MLLSSYQSLAPEAGCDEAGRGCLAGPVVAAAVIFPKNYSNKFLNDSKQLSQRKRCELRKQIERDAIAFAVAFVDVATIDKINILNSAILAMHKALDDLAIQPNYVIIDGNQFKTYKGIPHQTIVGGDAKYLSIAAASILAKTARDEYMENLHHNFPQYYWNRNKGYGTLEHREAILKHGKTEHHRKSFVLKTQLRLL